MSLQSILSCSVEPFQSCIEGSAKNAYATNREFRDFIKRYNGLCLAKEVEVGGLQFAAEIVTEVMLCSPLVVVGIPGFCRGDKAVLLLEAEKLGWRARLCRSRRRNSRQNIS